MNYEMALVYVALLIVNVISYILLICLKYKNEKNEGAVKIINAALAIVISTYLINLHRLFL